MAEGGGRDHKQQKAGGDSQGADSDAQTDGDRMRAAAMQKIVAAKRFNAANPQLVEEFNRLTDNACVQGDGLSIRALMRWQADHGLPADGKLSPATIAAAKSGGAAEEKDGAEKTDKSEKAMVVNEAAAPSKTHAPPKVVNEAAAPSRKNAPSKVADEPVEADAAVVKSAKPHGEAAVEGERANSSPEPAAAATAPKAEPHGPQHIQGDEMVMQAGDGSVADADVEATAAKEKLTQKIINTERAIEKGARDALMHQLGAHAEKKDESAQEKTVEALKEPFKDKLTEWVKGKALQSKAVKGGAGGKALKNKLATEGSQMIGKAAGAVAVVGTVKDIVDAVEEAEVADFTANTWQGLMDEIDAKVGPAFDAYRKHVKVMDAQAAIDAAAGETAAPWVTAESVKEQLLRLFDAMEIQASAKRGGPLKGGAVFDKVQEVLHPEKKEKGE